MKVERILVRGVNWLGDAVMTTPALARLREARPGAHITVLTPHKLADLWRHHDSIDSVLSLDKEEPLAQLAARLRQENFDIGIAMPNSPRSALELWLAHIPRRIGYGGQGRDILLTDSIPAGGAAVRGHKLTVREVKRLKRDGRSIAGRLQTAEHHITYYMRLVQELGAHGSALAPRVTVAGDEVFEAQKLFGLPHDQPERPLLGMHPGAEHGPAKRWPLERFISTAVELQERTNCRWIVVGGAADQGLGEKVRAAVQAAADSRRRSNGAGEQAIWNLAGRTTLRQLCALLKGCRAFLTNDTGPMHLAAAVGTAVVAPFGSTSPELTGPGRPGDTRHRLLRGEAPCAPCLLKACPIDHRCMTSIRVEDAVDALLASCAGTEQVLA